MSEEIKEGDVVCLKSDTDYATPILMTVAAIDYKIADCRWFHYQSGEMRKVSIPVAALHKK